MRSSAVFALAAVHAAAAVAAPAMFINGVCVGGLLLTEPSWMFDEFSASVEGRKKKGRVMQWQ